MKKSYLLSTVPSEILLRIYNYLNYDTKINFVISTCDNILITEFSKNYHNYSDNLIKAIEHNCTDLSVALIRDGADVNVYNPRYASLLTIASYNDNPIIVEELMKADAPYETMRRKFKRIYYIRTLSLYNFNSPLIWAAKKSHTGETVELLLKGNKSTVDYSRIDDALWYAICFNNKIAIKLLVNAGFPVGYDKFTSVYLNKLTLAAKNGNIDIVKLLLDAGACTNEIDYHHRTPLMKAAGHGHLNVVDVLIQKGADINSIDHGGMTALILASRYNHVSIVKMLINAGADVNLRERYIPGIHLHYRSALIWALGKNHTEIVKVLLDAGAIFKDAEKYRYSFHYRKLQSVIKIFQT